MSVSAPRPEWIAVDWGTSHLRLWRMPRSGVALDRTDSDKGMGRLTRDQFEPVLLDLVQNDLPAEGHLTVICCGMAGSRQGWSEARYLAVPSAPPSIAQATHVQTRSPSLSVHILPGLSQASPADVMRGEETQISGFLSTEPDFDGVLCLPGTHSKWAHVSAGEVVSFRTFMTGELFALLSGQSVLRHSLASSGLDPESFSGAVAHVMSRPEGLAGDLFSLRAESLLSGLDATAARSRLSGLLIGAELAAARSYWLGRDIVIAGESGIASAYQIALAAQGADPRMVDAEEMTLNGLRAAYAQLREHAL
ncbi:putative 2-dehydro-3-deoxygalactonokinase DgoK1 [Defluviimonas aquaemixtae]|uniref:Putative 2-dehydro-3-deoxygalactonokinase DgoK1 n=1 Tax=Albidovulum aquaemixtae TaxID=1542388 RepID=A0A2R8B849_9RHOB|nr:2-dehydro-3-deoxygalactonokinase [Defluviimonas aquaemixtae]SPH18742.1 putative 2-dehydro-3-deoxygalactonokinase DgoK1 [Defluviimonas aquaemixtae]